jgi:hypothetical protein
MDMTWQAISSVIPAKAGIHPSTALLQPWIPAFAGMTTKKSVADDL